MSRGGRVLKIVQPVRGQLTYLGEEKVCLEKWGQGNTIKIRYKMNFVQDCFQRFSQQLKSAFHWLLLEVYCTTQKKHISEYVCKTFLEELIIFLNCRAFFENLLQPVMFLKMILFFCHILRTAPKDFRSFPIFF